ncbi:50S ribosomal protein L6 [Salinarchaeum laminariae]|uniref:50S ribosomal protein L6 n=1 Tax=Salinarchaeum laminariae TaxID=869888 RepID=UPI0020C15175|nr:50S ribosomal protein L6 [Salinarchaeum laminariae]
MPRTDIPIPEAVDVEIDHLDLTVSGDNGSVTRRLWYPDVTISLEEVDVEADGDDADTESVDAVVIESDADDAKTMSTLGTFESHVENMFHGVSDGWTYEMEVFYNHFPMQVTVENEEVVIENFLGERAPRRAPIHGDDTQVQVDEEEITVSGPDKEAVGQTAADIEQLTRVNDKDVRVFQDGVYITNKPRKGGA